MTRSKSVVRPATHADFPEIAALLDRTFGARAYDRRLKLWKWRYDCNPARTDAFPSFLVMERESRIVGVHGLIPFRVKAGSERLFASCSCDLAVDPSARSAGMALKMKALGKELSPLHISTSANEPANKITMALGGREIAIGRRKFIKPLKVSGLLRRGWAERGALTRIAATSSMAILKPVDWVLSVANTRRPRRKNGGGTIRDITRFDERFDRFWEQMAKEHVILVVRDSTYLNWRYAAYPFGGIQSFELACREKLLGFAVIHITLDEDQIRFAALLEIACLDRECGILEHLLGEAIQRALKAGAHYMIAAPTSACEGLFPRLGFRARDFHFSPVTYKNNSDVPEELFAQGRNWYLSLGDGDSCYYFETER